MSAHPEKLISDERTEAISDQLSAKNFKNDEFADG
jgi:hypothetical protein